jgi:hypothetical protein
MKPPRRPLWWVATAGSRLAFDLSLSPDRARSAVVNAGVARGAGVGRGWQRLGCSRAKRVAATHEGVVGIAGGSASPTMVATVPTMSVTLGRLDRLRAGPLLAMNAHACSMIAVCVPSTALSAVLRTETAIMGRRAQGAGRVRSARPPPVQRRCQDRQSSQGVR